MSPATASDFALSTNKTLTIAAGSKTSTGTVTVTAVDNDVDAPNKSVTVSATVSGGNGVSAPADQTLTITDDDGAPTVSLVAGHLVDQRERRLDGRHGDAERGIESGRDADGLRNPGVAGRRHRDFSLSTNKKLTIAAGSKTSTGTVTITAADNDVDAPDKSVTVSATVSGGNGVSAPSESDVDDHRRRRHADRLTGPRAPPRSPRMAAPRHGHGDVERRVEPGRDADCLGGRGVACDRIRLHASAPTRP